MPSFELFTAMSIIVPVVFVIAFAAIIVFAVVNFRRIRKAGHNPFTLNADLASRALDSRLLAPDQPLEKRLDELDRLRAAGRITDEEHERARASILSGR